MVGSQFDIYCLHHPVFGNLRPRASTQESGFCGLFSRFHSVTSAEKYRSLGRFRRLCLRRQKSRPRRGQQVSASALGLARYCPRNAAEPGGKPRFERHVQATAPRAKPDHDEQPFPDQQLTPRLAKSGSLRSHC
jgi:hypothetical protein